MKKYKRSQTEVQCFNCKKMFLKDSSEVIRNIRIGRKDHCSLSCAGVTNHSHLEPYCGKVDITQYAKNQKDEYTGFRDFLRRIKIKNRTKFRETDLTLEDLKTLIEEQNYKCTYSGVTLNLPDYKKRNNKIYTASLDRIDSTKGYVEGNVQFISIAMNHMKK